MDREICLLRSSRSCQVEGHINHHKNGALMSGINGFMEEISSLPSCIHARIQQKDGFLQARKQPPADSKSVLWSWASRVQTLRHISHPNLQKSGIVPRSSMSIRKHPRVSMGWNYTVLEIRNHTRSAFVALHSDSRHQLGRCRGFSPSLIDWF